MAARIRTVKPSLFRHVDLFDAEQATGLPLRFAFIGMLTVADRKGRFPWRPRELKLDVLPHDAVDFGKVLDALWAARFIERYRVDGSDYGWFSTWERHQVINNRESASILPAPTDDNLIPRERDACPTRAPRVSDASVTPLVHAPVEGEGEGEGNWKESSSTPPARGRAEVPDDFAEFWSTWPPGSRKQSKSECLKLWRKDGLSSESAAIVAHVRAMSRSADWTKDEGRFVPAPAVYLRQRRWDGSDIDAIPATPPNGSRSALSSDFVFGSGS
jgi:hypothetical protein